MKHLKLFLEYTSYGEERINDILDKISENGIDSLTPEEKSFLDAQKNGAEASAEALIELEKSDKVFLNKTFEYIDEYPFPFKFELKSIEKEDSNSDDGIITTYHGIITLPDIVNDNGDITSGVIEGDIQINEHGLTMTSFGKEEYTDYDFAEGLEYEYDNFIHNVSVDLQI